MASESEREASGPGLFFRGTALAKVVGHDVECGEEGVHVKHEESVPFPSGSGGKLTLICGHLPLKSQAANSHQASKSFWGRWAQATRKKSQGHSWMRWLMRFALQLNG
jgi:hypothetical protein